VRFALGTLEVRGLSPEQAEGLSWDDRALCHRVSAHEYAPLLRRLHKAGIPFDDQARSYDSLALVPREQRQPRPFQTESIAAWTGQKSRGVVVLPTGAGKSHVALLAMLEKGRSTLVIAPTLDLVRQWHETLTRFFAIEVGILGGGEHEVRPVTVSTYDSAHLHMERYGNRFGLVVFDECHHLPGDTYSEAARMCIAPFRLGLTATPERSDGRESLLDELVGPVVYRKNITDMAGTYLAEYETRRIVVELSPEEREEYEQARDLYLNFVRSQGIALSSPRGFQEFVGRSTRTEAGRRAYAGYRRQRSLAFAPAAKLEKLEELLTRHAADRSIIFTEDNRTAYEISRRFLVPIITHQTKVKERTDILSGLAEGRYQAIVTSKVLNEGVDVPSASVAIVVSGNSSVLEHVQRLGRILRQVGDKRATLYELVSGNTSEAKTSDRRREHAAYRARRWRSP
jgi:superfamily II DNA or RNA helicase